MKRALSWWAQNFLWAEFAASVVLTAAFVVWANWFDGQSVIAKTIDGNRAAVYGALASIFGSLLGFAIIAESIVLGLSGSERLAYARQLHSAADLPAGSFETHFTFAPALTEAAKAAKNTLLVMSIPASESPHQRVDRGVTDIEVGGERGREALTRLKNAIGRVEASWRPASPDEGFEIVRRRLFQPLSNEKAKDRDVVARAFVDLYGSQQQEFPSECREADYERRIKMAYPIHPEMFDRLYNDWSTLGKFQRTRGVLRLMAAVIHSLWERQDGNLLIMPGNVPVDDQMVQFELTRYLEDQWVPVIEKDVDGPTSLPLAIDRDNPNLGRYSATRRVSRTIYVGSAPTLRAAHRGIEDRQVKLGCVQPGEAVATFGDRRVQPERSSGGNLSRLLCAARQCPRTGNAGSRHRSHATCSKSAHWCNRPPATSGSTSPAIGSAKACTVARSPPCDNSWTSFTSPDARAAGCRSRVGTTRRIVSEWPSPPRRSNNHIPHRSEIGLLRCRV